MTCMGATCPRLAAGTSGVRPRKGVHTASLLISVLIALVVLAVVLYVVQLLGAALTLDGRLVRAIQIVIVLIVLLWLLTRVVPVTMWP
jgi:hypothetical protein